MAAAIATWSFGLEAVKIASHALENDVSSVDAVEMAINSVEDNPNTGVYLVGRGAYPNSDGVVQLDAAIMRGTDNAIGSVCSIEGVSKPISVARHIMEYSTSNVLVGDGATSYARNNGFEMIKNDKLLSNVSSKAYKEFRDNQLVQVNNSSSIHDTLSMICLDHHGNVCAGVSTSGRPFKPPGRVGDSPLPGCGFYADNTSGGAAATGNGETIMKYCPSFKIVDLMNQGYSPQEACETVIKHITSKEKDELEMGVIALDIKGNIGACGTIKEWTDTVTRVVYKGFPYAQWKEKETLPTILTHTL